MDLSASGINLTEVPTYTRLDCKEVNQREGDVERCETSVFSCLLELCLLAVVLERRAYR